MHTHPRTHTHARTLTHSHAHTHTPPTTQHARARTHANCEPTPAVAGSHAAARELATAEKLAYDGARPCDNAESDDPTTGEHGPKTRGTKWGGATAAAHHYVHERYRVSA